MAEEVNEVRRLATGIFLLIVLLIIGVYYLYPLFQTFLSVGKLESPEVAQAKKQCEDYVSLHGVTDGCALNVAAKILETDGDLFTAQSFLKKEIESTKDQAILKRCFSFAKDGLYPKSNDLEGASEIYTLLASKITDSKMKSEIINGQLDLYVSRVKELYQAKDINEAKSNLPIIQDILRNAVKFYEKNKIIAKDKQILEVSSNDNICKTGLSVTYGDHKVACSTLARVSLANGCYYSGAGYSCQSCNTYRAIITEEVCDGYDNKGACETDACNKGSCKWFPEDNRCRAVLGAPNNYWDLS